MTQAYPAGSVRCAICGIEATFIELAKNHQHPEPAPELLAALQASLQPKVPAIGHTSQGTGELAGGDVQALPRTHKPRTRRANRHDQRAPLPLRVDIEGSIRSEYANGASVEKLAYRYSATTEQIQRILR